MSVTLFTIARNHAHLLPAALGSAKGVVDKILVVDTGSTDGSPEAALDLGADVVRFDWKNDFAAACNAALNAVRTPWALLLNPDETLDRTTAARIPKALDEEGIFAYSLRVQQQLAAERPAYGTANRQWRLFRAHPDLRYRGRLHPFLSPAPDALAPRLGFNTADLDTVIFRHAYRNTVTEDKIRWTIQLLEAELAERPAQVDFIIELGQNLLLLDDPRAREIFRKASEMLKPTLQANGPPTPGSGPLFEYLLTAGELPADAPLDRKLAFQYASQWFLRNPPVVWAMATERFRAKDYATAAALLNQLISLGREGNYNSELGFDPDILGRAAMLNLGKCYLLLGKKDDARKCLEAVVADVDHGAEARKLLARIGPVEA